MGSRLLQLLALALWPCSCHATLVTDTVAYNCDGLSGLQVQNYHSSFADSNSEVQVLSMKGENSLPLHGGRYTLTVKKVGENGGFTADGDICESKTHELPFGEGTVHVMGLTCPVQPGPFRMSAGFKLDADHDYVLSLRVIEDGGKSAACILAEIPATRSLLSTQSQLAEEPIIKSEGEGVEVRAAPVDAPSKLGGMWDGIDSAIANIVADTIIAFVTKLDLSAINLAIKDFHLPALNVEATLDWSKLYIDICSPSAVFNATLIAHKELYNVKMPVHEQLTIAASITGEEAVTMNVTIGAEDGTIDLDMDVQEDSTMHVNYESPHQVLDIKLHGQPEFDVTMIPSKQATMEVQQRADKVESDVHINADSIVMDAKLDSRVSMDVTLVYTDFTGLSDTVLNLMLAQQIMVAAVMLLQTLTITRLTTRMRRVFRGRGKRGEEDVAPVKLHGVAKLALFCVRCGEGNPRRSAFCRACGNKHAYGLPTARRMSGDEDTSDLRVENENEVPLLDPSGEAN